MNGFTRSCRTTVSVARLYASKRFSGCVTTSGESSPTVSREVPKNSRKLLRTEGDLLIQYSVPRTEEIHLIDFGRTEVDRADPSLGFIEERDRKVTIRGMTFERCVVIGSGFVDHEVGVYAPGIGLVESSWLYGRKQLVHARVDGVELDII